MAVVWIVILVIALIAAAGAGYFGYRRFFSAEASQAEAADAAENVLKAGVAAQEDLSEEVKQCLTLADSWGSVGRQQLERMASRLYFLSAMHRNKLLGMIQTFYDKKKTALCKCITEYLKLHAKDPENASFETAWYKPASGKDSDYGLVAQCAIKKTTWADYQPMMDYICNAVMDRNLLQRIHSFLGLRSDLVIPGEALLADINKMCQCLMSFIKSEWPSPADLFGEMRNHVRSNSDQMVERRVIQIVQLAYDKCYANSALCQSTANFDAYIEKLEKSHGSRLQKQRKQTCDRAKVFGSLRDLGREVRKGLKQLDRNPILGFGARTTRATGIEPTAVDFAEEQAMMK